VDAQDSSILDAPSFREELASELSRAKRGSRRLSIVGRLPRPGAIRADPAGNGRARSAGDRRKAQVCDRRLRCGIRGASGRHRSCKLRKTRPVRECTTSSGRTGRKAQSHSY